MRLSVPKQSKLHKQITAYIEEKFHLSNVKLKALEINNDKIYFRIENVQYEEDIPFNEWKNGKINEQHYNETKKNNKNKKENIQNYITQRINKIKNEFKSFAFSYSVNKDTVYLVANHKIYKKKFKESFIIKEINTNAINNTIENNINILIQKLQLYILEIQYIKERENEILDLLFKALSKKFSKNFSDDYYIKIENIILPLDKQTFIKCIYLLDYELLLENNKIRKIIITEKVKSDFIDLILNLFKCGINYPVEKSILIKKALTNLESCKLFYGIQFDSLKNQKFFQVRYNKNIFFIVINNNIGNLIYTNNRFVYMKKNDLKNVDEELNNSISYLKNLFEDIINDIDYVSGEGLLNGKTFILIKKDYPILFAVNIKPYKDNSWKQSIKDYSVLIHNALTKDDIYGDDEMHLKLRKNNNNYGSFLIQDILNLIYKNENIAKKDIANNLKGIKVSQNIKNIEHSGIYNLMPKDKILKEYNMLLEKQYIENKNGKKKINPSSGIFWGKNIYPSQIPQIIKQNKLNSYELKYLMNKENKTNEEWLWFIGGFNNEEFIYIYYNEIINSLLKADKFIIDYIEMKSENNFFKHKISKDIVNDILNKTKHNISVIFQKE